MLTPLLAAALLLFQAAAPAKSDDLAPQVRDLAASLDAGEVAQRDAAEKKLIELGPPALDHLPRVTPRTSAEAKQRLGRIRQTLELAHAKTAGQTTRITLQGDNLPLADVLAAIEKQTGNKLLDLRRGEKEKLPDVKLKLALADQPFWPALDEILDQTNFSLELQPQTEEQEAVAALGLVPRLPGHRARRGNALYQGPLRIEVANVTARRDAINPAASLLRVELAVAWEPRLAPIALLQSAKTTKAIDDRGRTLTNDNESQQLEIPVPRGVQGLALQIPLELPPREVKKLATLSGELTLLVPGRVQSFRFDKLTSRKAGDNEHSRGDVTAKVVSAERNNELLSVRVHAAYGDTAGTLQSHYGWLYEKRGRLETADGKTIDAAGFESGAVEGGIAAAYHFDVEGTPDKFTFVFELPAVMLKVPVQYELKDIALP